MVKRKTKLLKIGGVKILPGEVKDIKLKVSESYTGRSETLSVRVIRSLESGPIVFLTGVVHGDELTGLGVIREIMFKKLELLKGTLICAPILNNYGFENHSRYLPDRRDLNRSFPGSATAAGRLANVVTEEIIKKSDYGIDLHSAATRRTNFPQIRGDMEDQSIRKIAKAFGCELIIHNKGPQESLRASASNQGCPTIIYEAGETLKFEPGTIKLGVRGVMNVLKTLGMLKGNPIKPIYQTVIKKTSWIRSSNGGLLKFYVKPGDLVKKGKKIASCHKLFSKESELLKSPMDGIVLGMTTLPAVKPGEPICHIAKPDTPIREIASQMKKSSTTLHRRIERELATSFVIEEE
ncbi:MAG: putative deacylase [Candidatus Omnitrophota bacterium]